MPLLSFLRTLSTAHGPTGGEGAVAEIAAQLLAPLCDEVTIDPLFNVIGRKQGQGPEPRPQLMLMAHLDEVYALVAAVEGPFLRLTQTHADYRLLVGQEVIVLGRRPLAGVIGDRPPHLMAAEERQRMPRLHDLVVDLGRDAAEVAAWVSPGDVVLVDRPFVELQGRRVTGKALDNRAGVSVMLATLQHLQDQPHACDLLAVASVGEELNLLGAHTASFRLRPDLAIVLDVTFAEQPGADKDKTFPLGDGPVLGIGPNLHPRLGEALAATAARLELAHGLEPLPANSGTDAWAVQVAAGGRPTALISLPIRNMHSPVEVADLADLEGAARWLAAFIPEVDAAFLAGLAYQLPTFDEAPA